MDPEDIAKSLLNQISEKDYEYKIIIIDTVNAIGIQEGMNKQESMKYWNQEIALKTFRNENNCTVINIMQLDAESGKRQFNAQGNNVEEKYIPTLETIGNDKEAARSASLVLSLFDPATFKIPQLNKYNITKFNGTLRFIYVLKNNFGEKNVSFPFVYHGASNEWIEVIHTPQELEKDPELYETYYRITPIKNTLGNYLSGKKSDEILARMRKND